MKSNDDLWIFDTTVELSPLTAEELTNLIVRLNSAVNKLRPRSIWNNSARNLMIELVIVKRAAIDLFRQKFSMPHRP